LTGSRSVDWFRVLTDLDRAGVRLPAVAETIGVPYPTLVSIRNGGGEPLYRNGSAILGLWCSVLQRTASDVPAREPILSAAKAKL